MEYDVYNLYDKYMHDNKDDSVIEESTDDIFYEASSPKSKIMLEYIYPKVNNTLSSPSGDRKFKELIGKYIDRNQTRLYTIGPQFLIPFTDNDKKEYFDLFQINQTELVNKVKSLVKSINDKSNFIYLTNNPILWLFYCCIRYYHIKKDKKGLNSALAIYALAVYPSVHSMIFPYEPNEAIMQYTIDHLSEKYIIKQAGNIFTTLFTSISHSYDFLKGNLVEATDGEIIRFIQRIRNDQKSLLKNIADQYMSNYRKGLRVSSNLDSQSDIVIDPNKENDTSVVDSVTNKVIVPILTNGINLQIASQAKAIAQISLADCKYYISKILTDKYSDYIRAFIQAILFRFLYDDKKKKEDINSKEYLVWASSLFRQTNARNDNVQLIKNTLSKWADETGIYSKFKREASRVNYKKAIFFYFIISIQVYNQI